MIRRLHRVFKTGHISSQAFAPGGAELDNDPSRGQRDDDQKDDLPQVAASQEE